MRCSELLALSLLIGLGVPTGWSKDESKPKEAKSDSGKKKDKDKSKKKDKEKDEKEGNRMSLPLVKGHDSKGVRIPYFGSDGKLQMNFAIGLADRFDDDHVKMTDLQVETFNDSGASEMVIELPVSILDLNTKILSTDQSVTIRRSDFEMTGRTMEFNTETKQGKIGGNVRMLIYNLREEEPEGAKKSEEAKK